MHRKNPSNVVTLIFNTLCLQNLFLFPSDDDDEGQDQSDKKQQDARTPVIGELEIMVARPEARGQGLAQEALQAFMWYISTSLPAILKEYTPHQDQGKESALSYLRVKIDQENKRSLSLFGKLGFKHSSGPNYFGELELRASISDAGDKGNGTIVNVEKLPYGTL